MKFPSDAFLVPISALNKKDRSNLPTSKFWTNYKKLSEDIREGIKQISFDDELSEKLEEFHIVEKELAYVIASCFFHHPVKNAFKELHGHEIESRKFRKHLARSLKPLPFLAKPIKTLINLPNAVGDRMEDAYWEIAIQLEKLSKKIPAVLKDLRRVHKQKPGPKISAKIYLYLQIYNLIPRNKISSSDGAEYKLIQHIASRLGIEVLHGNIRRDLKPFLPNKKRRSPSKKS